MSCRRFDGNSSFMGAGEIRPVINCEADIWSFCETNVVIPTLNSGENLVVPCESNDEKPE